MKTYQVECCLDSDADPIVLTFPANCKYPTREQVECLLFEIGKQDHFAFALDHDQIALDEGMRYCAHIYCGDSEYMVPDELYFAEYPRYNMIDKAVVRGPLCDRWQLERVRCLYEQSEQSLALDKVTSAVKELGYTHISPESLTALLDEMNDGRMRDVRGAYNLTMAGFRALFAE